MTGPEHYRAAEDLVHDANLILQQSTPHTAEAANAGASALAAAAQVHATLALAAATAASRTAWANPADNYTATYVDGDGWAEAIA